MNVLFVGPYRQLDEWGHKSSALLRAIAGQVDGLTSRPIYLSGAGADGAFNMELTSFDNYDVLIQFCLPMISAYNGSFKKNIGVFNFESIPTIKRSLAISRINLMDEVWVDSEEVAISLKSMTDTKVSLLRPHIDNSILEYNTGTIMRNEESKDKFIFYFIGSMEQKSGVEEALCAYFSEFNVHDNTVFCVLLENPSPPEKVQELIDLCQRKVGVIKRADKFPAVHFLNPPGGFMGESRVTAHKEGDCFVSTSYTFGTNTSVMESVCFGNTPIINSLTESYRVLGDDNSWGVESYKDSCVLKDRPFSDMFTSEEMCQKPIIRSIATCMRGAFTDKFQRDKKKKNNAKFTRSLTSADYSNYLGELICS